MIPEIITIKRAVPECLEEVLEILSQAGLPNDGVKEHLSGFLIAWSGGGKIVGCVGLERHGELGLLRSAAVLSDYQGQGIGNKLVVKLLRRAATDGISEVVLLTTTVKEYFQTKFGFKESIRSHYDKRLADSPEWNLPRCSSAAFMTLKLKPGAESIS